MRTPGDARRGGLRALAAVIVRRAVDASLRAVREEMRSTTARGERSVQTAVVLHVDTDTDGRTWADVRCTPTGLRLTVRVANPSRGAAERPQVGDEVVVLLPRGDLYGCGVLLCALPTDARPGPSLTSSGAWTVETAEEIQMYADGRVHVESDADVEIVADGEFAARGGTVSLASTAGSVTVQAVGGSVQILASAAVSLSAPAVALGSSGLAVARASDPVTVTIPSNVLAWLNAVGALPGGPGTFPAGSFSGTVTSGASGITA